MLVSHAYAEPAPVTPWTTRVTQTEWRHAVLIDTALAETAARVPGCLVAAFVDQPTGALLGVRCTQRRSPDSLELLATTAAEVFGGPTATALSEALHTGGAGSGEPTTPSAFHEVLLRSPELSCIFVRAPAGPQVLAVVCEASTSLGIALQATRAAAARFETF